MANFLDNELKPKIYVLLRILYCTVVLVNKPDPYQLVTFVLHRILYCTVVLVNKPDPYQLVSTSYLWYTKYIVNCNISDQTYYTMVCLCMYTMDQEWMNSTIITVKYNT